MDQDANIDEPGGGLLNWLRSLFSGDGTKAFLSFLGLERESKHSEPRSLSITPSIYYDDVQNANTSLDFKASPLEKARKALKDIQDGTFHYAADSGYSASTVISSHLELGPDVVREWLQRAKLDASALDPAKTAEENEAMLRDAPRFGHIARARKFLAAMTSPDQNLGLNAHTVMDKPREIHDGLLLNDPRDLAQLVQAELDKANRAALANGEAPVDISALDPTRSPDQMQQKLHRRIIEGYIINARKELFFLRNAGDNPTHDDDNKTQQWLNKANEAAKEFGFNPIDASMLDSTGKESATAMDRNILEAIEKEHIEKASQILYWSQNGGIANPEDAAQYLRKELSEANTAASALGEKPIDVSVLDPNNAKYRAQVGKDLAEIKGLAEGNLGTIQAAIDRESRNLAAADKFAMQNETVLAALIRPLDTPSQQVFAPQSQGKQ